MDQENGLREISPNHITVGRWVTPTNPQKPATIWFKKYGFSLFFFFLSLETLFFRGLVGWSSVMTSVGFKILFNACFRHDKSVEIVKHQIVVIYVFPFPPP